MGFLCLAHGTTIQKDRSARRYRCQCIESWRKPHTSIKMLRTQNSYSESFTQQISSVFTEQFHYGVNSSISIKVRENHIRRKLKKLWTRKHWNIVNKEILKSMNSQEVKSLVSTTRKLPASGNGLRKILENFDCDPELIRCKCFLSLHQSGKTMPDVEDVFGGFTTGVTNFGQNEVWPSCFTVFGQTIFGQHQLRPN